MKKVTIIGFVLINCICSIRSQFCFLPHADYPINGSGNPYDIIANDFNNDGFQDIGIADWQANTISIRLGIGNGTFGSMSSYPASNRPISLTSADFNEDGNVDIATANYLSNNVSIKIGTGSGVFTGSSTFAAATNPSGITSADLNNDGHADLIVTNATSNNLSVLLGTGTGSFGTHTDFPTGLRPYACSSSDLNNDGNLDVVTVNYNSGTISVLIGNGLGGFSSTLSYVSALSPRAVSTGDLNNDSFKDIVVANGGNSSVSVFLADGLGGFNPRVLYSVNGSPYDVMIADFNNDGDLDVSSVNFSTGTISVLKGNGTGVLLPMVNFATGNSCYAGIEDDFNGDTKVDIANTNDVILGLSILLNCYTPCVNTTSNINVTTCNEYTSPSGIYTYYASGTYADTIDNVGGCDSIISIQLTVNNNSIDTIIVESCDEYNSPSGIYTWTNSGIYQDTIPNYLGCDSTIFINLTILGNTSSAINVTTCNSYISPSNNYTWTNSGIYVDTIPNSHGCDSIITIGLTINTNTNSTIYPVSCNNYLSPSGNYTWLSSGNYLDTLINANGCDSIIAIFLTINNHTSSSINPISCNSYIAPSGNYSWGTSGIYLDTIPNSQGCDSIITINLTILNESYFNINISSCDSVISPSGNEVWEVTGVYVDTVTNSLGCDSIISVNVTILENSFSTLNQTTCNPIVSPSGMYTWVNSGIYQDTIPNQVGCDSILTIHLTVLDCFGLYNSDPATFKFYPNPTRGFIQITGEVELGETYAIVNLLGEKILWGNIGSDYRIDCSDLLQGTYFLRINGKYLKLLKE